MLNTLCQFIIFFDNLTWYFLLLLLGLCSTKHRKIFYWGMVGCFLSILYNASLKSFFKVPLLPHLGPGYAFPSGHLELATFIYTWLAKFKVFYIHKFFFILIPIFAYATVKLNFHTPIEVMGGIVAGGLFFLIYFYIYNRASGLRIKAILAIWLLISLLSYQYIFTSKTLILFWIALPISLFTSIYLKWTNKD